MSDPLALYTLFYRLVLEEAALDANKAPNTAYTAINIRKAEATAQAQSLLGDGFDPTVFARNAELTPGGVKTGCYHAVLQLDRSDPSVLDNPLSKWSVVHAALPKSGFDAMCQCLTFLATGCGVVAVATLGVTTEIVFTERSVGGFENMLVCETVTQRRLHVAVKMLVPLCGILEACNIYPILTMEIPGVSKFAPTLCGTVIGAPQPMRPNARPLSPADLSELRGRTLCVPDVFASLFMPPVSTYAQEVGSDVIKMRGIAERDAATAVLNGEILDDQEKSSFWNELGLAARVPASTVSDDHCLGFRSLMSVFYATNPFKFGMSSGSCNCLLAMEYWQMVVLFLSVGRYVQGDAFWVRHPSEPEAGGFQLEHFLCNMGATEPPQFEAVWAAEVHRLGFDTSPPVSALGQQLLVNHMSRIQDVVDARLLAYESMCALRAMPREDIMRLLMDVVIFTKNQVVCWYRLKPETIDIVGMMDRMAAQEKGLSFVDPEKTYGVFGMHRAPDMSGGNRSWEVITLLTAPSGMTFQDPSVCAGQVGLVLDVRRLAGVCDRASFHVSDREERRRCVHDVREIKKPLTVWKNCVFQPCEYSGFLNGSKVSQLGELNICRGLFAASELEERRHERLGLRFLSSCQFSKHVFGVVVADKEYFAELSPDVVGATFYVLDTSTDRVVLALRIKVSSLWKHGLRNIHYVPATGTLLLADLSSQGVLTVFQRPLDLTRRLVPKVAGRSVMGGSLLLRLLYGGEGNERVQVAIGGMAFLYGGMEQYARVKALITKECTRLKDVTLILNTRVDAATLCAADAFPGGDGVLGLLLDQFCSRVDSFRDMRTRCDSAGVMHSLVCSCLNTRLCSGRVDGHDGVFRMLMCVLLHSAHVGIDTTVMCFRDYIRANTAKVLEAMIVRFNTVSVSNFEVVVRSVEGGVPSSYLSRFMARHDFSCTVIDMLILRGASVHVLVEKTGMPLLHHLLDANGANQVECIGVMGVFAKHGYDLNAEHDGENLLQKALASGLATFADELVRRGIDPASAKGVWLNRSHPYMTDPHMVEAQAFRLLFAKKVVSPNVVEVFDSDSDGGAARKRIRRGASGQASVKREKTGSK